MLPELHDCTVDSTKASASQGCGPAVIHRGWRKAVLSPCEQLQAVVNVLTSKAHCEGLAAITCAWHIKSHCGHHHAVGQSRQLRQLAWIKCNLVTHDLPVPAGHRGATWSAFLEGAEKTWLGLRARGKQAMPPRTQEGALKGPAHHTAAQPPV